MAFWPGVAIRFPGHAVPCVPDLLWRGPSGVFRIALYRMVLNYLNLHLLRRGRFLVLNKSIPGSLGRGRVPAQGCECDSMALPLRISAAAAQ